MNVGHLFLLEMEIRSAIWRPYGREENENYQYQGQRVRRGK